MAINKLIEFILENVNMDVLIGGLIAIITILVTKLLEIYQKSVEHKYSLQSTYFSKIIEAAELAVINFSNEVSKFNHYLAIEEKLVDASLEEYPFLMKQFSYAQEDAKKDEESIELLNKVKAEAIKYLAVVKKEMKKYNP
jgi:hypothetical protein